MDSQNLRTGSRWFLVGCAFELSLGVLAVLLAWLFNRPLFGDVRWSWKDLLAGLGSAAALFGLLLWTLNSHSSYDGRLRSVLERVIRPFFGGWSIFQLGVISIVAGICEELLFRGLIQGILHDTLRAAVPALVIASLIFGLAHFLSLEYFTITTLIGIYLSVIWAATDNLFTPIVAHAAYDFAALVYFLRIHRP
ncbi:MAG: CPBP family intramembrane metalloprotease [Verrucomicrobia bacterium]|nr:CPBP family intramembrane metalloprotease [Verrucomicrobiota bacterium]